MKPLTRRPIVGLALFFVAGTWVGLTAAVPAPALLWTAAILLAAAAGLAFVHDEGLPLPSGERVGVRVSSTESFRLRRACGPLSAILLFLATFTIACLNARFDACSPDAPAVASLATTNSANNGLIGVVTDDPVSAPAKKGVVWKFPLAVERARQGGKPDWSPASGTVNVNLHAIAAKPPRYGERWSLSGRWALFPRPGGTAMAFMSSFRDAHCLARDQGNPFVAWTLKCRQAAGELITTGITDFTEQVAILNSLLLGYRSQMPFELYRAFAATGTLHVFAISGEHVVVLGSVIVFIISVAGLQRTYWVLFLGPLIVLYTVMTGLQPSAIRACVMGIAFWLAPLFGRKPDIFASLALSAVLILAFVPADLFNAGFVLSYVAVLGIVFFYQPFCAPLRRRLEPDPLRVQQESGWIRALRAAGGHVAELMAMSTACCLVTAPLSAWYFGTVSPISLIGNLIAVPLSGLVIVTGAISLVGGLVAVPLADLFNHANLVLVSLMAASMRLFARVPGGYFQVGVPPAWLVAVFYLALAVWRFRIWLRANETPDDRGKPRPVRVTPRIRKKAAFPGGMTASQNLSQTPVFRAASSSSTVFASRLTSRSGNQVSLPLPADSQMRAGTTTLQQRPSSLPTASRSPSSLLSSTRPLSAQPQQLRPIPSFSSQARLCRRSQPSTSSPL